MSEQEPTIDLESLRANLERAGVTATVHMDILEWVTERADFKAGNVFADGTVWIVGQWGDATTPDTWAAFATIARFLAGPDAYEPEPCERVEHMARALYAAYGQIGEVNPQSWDEMAAEPDVFGYTLGKFRRAADQALDTIEWVKFSLALKKEG